MPQTCSKCSRVNPDEASYCYHDGSILDGHSANGGVLAAGKQNFPNQFVFPSGKGCRNFDQLAMALQEHWKEGIDLLKQGFVEAFLGGLGRADLALAAREAASFPDQDRGMDRLLSKLPTDVVAPPKLAVEPTVINLGQIKVGENRQVELHLENQGMRLLYGSVSCDDDSLWLGVGEAPGAPQKLFQFGSEMAVHVHIRGKHLRAGTKPLESKLIVESNGGNATVLVRAEVPVKPFSDGVLAGAVSPRQIAEKAKTAAKDAAGYFEKGAVAKWYEANGWTYPVQGPPASGLGAVQQFFEALGLTPPPKVDISERSVALQGNVGQTVHHVLEVKAQEKRPVYAHASSDQEWLKIGPANLNGRTATIPLTIPSVPNRQGETLQAKVTVTSNGNQQFEVPVTLEVGFSFDFDASAAQPAPAKEVPKKAEPSAVAKTSPAAATAAVATTTAAPATPVPAVEKPPREKVDWKALSPKKADLVHAAPAALLGLGLLVVVFLDILGRGPGAAPPPPTEQGLFVVELDDPEPRIAIKFNDKEGKGGRFGIVMTKEVDPNNPENLKRLTYDEWGETSNTCVMIDSHERLIGGKPGRWHQDGKKAWRLVELEKGRRWKSIYEYPEKILVTQLVELVPGEQTRVLDTCLVRYIIENKDNTVHTVGLRVMLDTFIGANDGVPFMIPGESALLETKRKFGQKEIPTFIQALEKPDPKDPGTVAVMGLKLQNMEEVETMQIGRWPGNSETRWDVKLEAMNEVVPGEERKKDSCVTLYWAYRKMDPGEKREMGFTYGLGTVAGTSGRIGVATHGPTRPGGVFTVNAYMKEPSEGQKVKLQLPPGLTLDGEESEEKTITKVEKGKDAQVSWRVKAGEVGAYPVTVTSGIAKQEYKVRINNQSIFD